MKPLSVDEGKVLRLVLTELAREGIKYVPVGVSVKHVHLSEGDLHTLFGDGSELHPLRNVVQPGQYAAKEQVTIVGPKGKLEKVRVIGPARGETQVELAITDAMAIGMKEVPIRMSGNLAGTPGVKLIGPKGEVNLSHGVIVAARHMHLSDEQAAAFRVHNGQVVSVRVGGERASIIQNVVCRTGNGHELEFHVDTDEANSCRIKSGDLLEVLLPGEECIDAQEKDIDPERIAARVVCALTGKNKNEEKTCPILAAKRMEACETILDLVTEKDINDAADKGLDFVYCRSNALITPSARDRSSELNIEIIRTEKADKKAVSKPSEGEEILELVTAGDLNLAFRDDKKEIFCTKTALITPAAVERSAETGIRITRVVEEG